MHMHALKCQYHKNMFGIISTPKVPASFPFQVQRSHTLSNWDAIQDAPCTWTKRICSLRSSAKTRKKSRQRKKQIQKIALVAMSTWTGVTYHPCRTRSKACSMKCLKSSDVVGPPSGYFILNPSWRYSEEFSMLVLESNIVCCIVPCQLLVETYGLDVNHKDSIGQTCSSTAILMPRLWIREQIDARKTPFTIRWCTKMQTVRVEVCVCVCPVHSCKIGIRWFWWHTSFISTSWKGRGFLILVWFQRNWFMWFMWLKRLFQEGTVFSTSLSGLNQVSTEGSWICLLKFSSIFDATSWNFCRFVLCGQFGSCGYHETTLGEVQGRCLDRRSLIESMS